MKKINYVGKDIQLEDDDLLKSGMKLTALDEAVSDAARSVCRSQLSGADQ